MSFLQVDSIFFGLPTFLGIGSQECGGFRFTGHSGTGAKVVKNVYVCAVCGHGNDSSCTARCPSLASGA
jgi:hypothetical protein